jgi:hypothetical protein
MTQQQDNPSRDSWSDALALPLGLLGAILGAILGGWLTNLIVSQGLYAIPLVGLTTGFGAVTLARRGGVGIAIVAGLVSLVGAIVTEWKIFPFIVDDSLSYFLQHLHQVIPIHLILIAVAAAGAAWIAYAAPIKRRSSRTA